ncbi:MAG TPA: SDR family NAD(P)-dependent oxidoreductase [Gaiellaceae bacterium]|jgi:NAD(P)-dependent dehydrogenase (short-subunit alcohol dehydrogenase family)
MRVAVVTGASSGIGAALCRTLRRDGWHVIGLSRSEAADADEHETCDVGDRAAVDAVAARVLERHPRIDLLVNNAGVAGREEFLRAEPELLEQLMRTNYFGSVWCVRAFLPGLVNGSRVVNVVSVAGLVAVGPYSASKHASLAFSRSVAVELSRRGVSVLTVNPGFVETPGFPQKHRFKYGSYRFVAQPQLVVDRILSAMESGRREIVVPRWYRVVTVPQALAPGFFARVRSRVGGRTGPQGE